MAAVRGRSTRRRSGAGTWKALRGRRRAGAAFLVSTLTAVVWATVAAGTASAETPILLDSFGSFAHPSGVAVDEATGNVFVADGGFNDSVEILGPEGEAPSGVAVSRIEGLSFGSEPSGIAVDNAVGSASRGAVYVADVGHSSVRKFELNSVTEEYEEGMALAATPGFGEPLGVTVDTKGNVYVADYGSSSVVFFDPAGVETGRIDVSSAVEHPSSVAVDSLGDLFVQGYLNGRVTKYAANGSGEIESGTVPTQVLSGGSSGIAVDTARDALYIALGKYVVPYDVQTLVAEPDFGKGILEFTERLAVDVGTGRIYVADRGPGKIFAFGPPPPPTTPEVLEESATATYTEAEVAALIDQGNEVATYHFEYGLTPSYGQVTPDVVTPATYEPAKVTAPLFGLTPGTAYHYRIVVENALGTAIGPDDTFSTKSRPAPGLPDNRAYELVTPEDTNGTFLATLLDGDVFETYAVRADGNSVIYSTEGSLPGTGGNGRVNGYEALRTSEGWQTVSVGPDGTQALNPLHGGTSSDLAYSFWMLNGGSLDVPNVAGNTHYVRLPDGTFELTGRGSLGDDPTARGRWISPGGVHIVFSTEAGYGLQLEPDAPPDGIDAIYDRTPGGPTHVVSLLPGDQTPSANALYQGTSQDGTAVAFKVEQTLYVRRGSVTSEIAGGDPLYEGVSADGDRIFYLKEGNAYRFEPGSGSTPIGSGGETTVVNVSDDGSHVYFSSPQPQEGAGISGASNLYAWDGASVGLVGVLSPEDFAEATFSLSNWSQAIGPEQSSAQGRGNVSARTTPDGSVFVFQSHGIDGFPYDSSGFNEVYRYDGVSGALSCVSCPAGAATSDAELQGGPGNPVALGNRLKNVTDDGTIVFFQSQEALVPEDTDGLRDVYEWRDGRVALISSGRSSSDDFLFGMTPNGHDVFFKTQDVLLPNDSTGGTGSIYDARIGGGFPLQLDPVAPCGEGSCQGLAGYSPPMQRSGSSLFVGPGNQRRRHHRHRRRHHRHHKHHRIGSHKQRGAK